MGYDEATITLSDLYPTILSICGLPIPGDISGRPFGRDAEPVIAEFFNYEVGKHRVLYDGTYKYLKFEYQRNDELYDLETDPLEKENLIKVLPEVASALEAKLTAWEKHHAPHVASSAITQQAAPPQAILREMRALGYIQ